MSLCFEKFDETCESLCIAIPIRFLIRVQQGVFFGKGTRYWRIPVVMAMGMIGFLWFLRELSTSYVTATIEEKET